MAQKTRVLIMAAGASKRLGQPKQLLMHHGQPLLSYTIEVCLSANIGPVTVCLGSNADAIASAIAHHPVDTVYCPTWSEGLGSTIAHTVQNIDTQDCDGLLIVLADQPYLTPATLVEIMEKVEISNCLVCACSYTEGSGPPVYFDKSLFSSLERLSGDTGAKPIVKQNQASVAYVAFAQGYIDIDTPPHLVHLR